MLRTDELHQEEEFQEADILWPDAAEAPESPRVYYAYVGTDDDGEYSGEPRHSVKLQVRRQKASSPIDIPGRKVVHPVGANGTDVSAGLNKFGVSHGGVGAGSVVAGSHVFVPPHVIVDRRAKRDKALMMLAVPSGRARARKQMRE